MGLSPTQLASANRYLSFAAREKRAALGSVRRSWRRMTPEFDDSWEFMAGPSVLSAVVQSQESLAGAAGDYVPAVLEETGQRVRDAEYRPRAGAWGGTAGDGRAVQSLAFGAVTTAKTRVAAGATAVQALRVGGDWLMQAMGTVLADTQRSAEQVHMRSRRVGSYVRMLTPPSCGRCIVLAGKTYGSMVAFERHPNCDCVHVPAAESVATDLRVNPASYLDGMSDQELAQVFGSRANAQAYKDGADMNQLINAYRKSGDVRPAQVYGRRVKYTTEGMTRHGWANRAMRQAGYIPDGDGALRAPRLMPESIYKLAANRDDAERLLKLYGWIL